MFNGPSATIIAMFDIKVKKEQKIDNPKANLLANNPHKKPPIKLDHPINPINPTHGSPIM